MKLQLKHAPAAKKMASTIKEHLTCRESAIAKVGKQGRDNSVKLTVSIQVTQNISFIMHTEKEEYRGLVL